MCGLALIELSPCQTQAWLFIILFYFLKREVLPATVYQSLGSFWEVSLPFFLLSPRWHFIGVTGYSTRLDFDDLDGTTSMKANELTQPA